MRESEHMGLIKSIFNVPPRIEDKYSLILSSFRSIKETRQGNTRFWFRWKWDIWMGLCSLVYPSTRRLWHCNPRRNPFKWFCVPCAIWKVCACRRVHWISCRCFGSSPSDSIEVKCSNGWYHKSSVEKITISRLGFQSMVPFKILSRSMFFSGSSHEGARALPTTQPSRCCCLWITSNTNR